MFLFKSNEISGPLYCWLLPNGSCTCGGIGGGGGRDGDGGCDDVIIGWSSLFTPAVAPTSKFSVGTHMRCLVFTWHPFCFFFLLQYHTITMTSRSDRTATIIPIRMSMLTLLSSDWSSA